MDDYTEQQSINNPSFSAPNGTDAQRKKRLSIKATRRVLAPYVKARHKPKVEIQENLYFKFYIQKKPSILMSDMTKLLFDGVDLLEVMEETALVLKEATYSAAVTVYMVDESLEEIYQITQNYAADEHRVSYKIETGTNVASHVAATKNFIRIPDLLEDIRFPCGLGNQEVTVKAVMCVPVMTPENDCLAVFELYRGIDDEEYSDQDLRLLIVMCGWVGATIYQNQQRLTLQKQQELNEYLLDLTKCYFADTVLLDKLITDVVNFAKIALCAEHGQFFVLKPKNDEMFADFYEESLDDQDILLKKNVKINLGNETNLVSTVARTGVTVNIKNAFTDTRVEYRQRDYITRSVLCIPIKGVDDILGVIQLINKKKGACFTKSDEVLFQTFSVFCGFVLSYNRLYDKMEKNNNLNNVYQELLTHQMLPCVHDYYFVSNHPEAPSIPPRFHQFDFYITDAYENYMPQLVMYMFSDISKDLFINTAQAAKFVLTVQKSYNDLPYHNFHHAFNVCHAMYNILRRNLTLFTLTEVRALIVAAYCHDVDHYGVTNNYLKITNHYLSQLYEESILENHHVHITLFIFKFLKLFTYMTADEYSSFIEEVKECILATDLTLYFKRRSKLYQICTDKKFNFRNDTHRSLLKSVMITMADLSDCCKPYNITKHLTDAVYKEYYAEGDKEKEMGLCPLSMLDRADVDMIPMDQVQFITIVVLPCALILSKLVPNCGPLYKEAVKQRDAWQELNETQGQKLWTLEDSFPDKKVH